MKWSHPLNEICPRSSQASWILVALTSILMSGLLQSAAADPDAVPAPTYAPRPDEGSGDLPTSDPSEWMPRIVVQECRKGFIKACSAGICLPEEYSSDRIARTCGYYESVAKQFSVRCEVNGNGFEFKSAFLGMVRTQADCDEINQAWKWFSSDARIRSQYRGDQALEIFNSLLQPETQKRKSDPAILSELKHKKGNDRFRVRDESLARRVQRNFEEWQEETWCGPGIVPGAEKLPVLNQRMQGTCFANAAATVLNFELQKEGYPPGYGISPTYLASEAIRSKEVLNTRDPFGGGWFCKTLQASKKVCEMTQVEGAIYRQMSAVGGLPEIKKHLSHRRKLYQSMLPLARTPHRREVLEGELEDLDPLSLKNDQTHLFLDVMGSFFETGDFESIARSMHEVSSGAGCSESEKLSFGDPLIIELALLPERDLKRFYSFLLDHLCQGAPPMPNAISNRKCRNDEYSEDGLESVLRRGSIAEVDINADFLKDSKAKRGTSDHEVVVIGTARDSKGVCGFVVRNSWGKGCGWADPEYDCKDGTVVIPKTIFKRAASYLNWL